jgi:hypothetical protein
VVDCELVSENGLAEADRMVRYLGVADSKRVLATEMRDQRVDIRCATKSFEIMLQSVVSDNFVVLIHVSCATGVWPLMADQKLPTRKLYLPTIRSEERD